MSSNDTNDTGSALALRSVALPAFTNAHGDIFGGWLLSQMDLAGGTVATRLAEGRIVTVAVTEMSFQRPGPVPRLQGAHRGDADRVSARIEAVFGWL